MDPNNAGGFAWKVDDWTLLHRFLVLGTEGGTYYVGEQKLTKDACDATMRCVKADGVRVVEVVTDISHSGRAPKNDYALFALAMCAGAGDAATRKAALKALPKVARIGTHLFNFTNYVEQFRGWGRGLREAVADWYNSKDPGRLAYQMIKYQQRDGWSHYDMLRLSHPNPNDAVSVPDTLSAEAVEYISPHGALYAWVTEKAKAEHWERMPALIGAFEEAKKATTAKEIIPLIQEHNLPRECVPTGLLSDKGVWSALLERMPMTAMIRNLGNMSKVGLLVQGNFDVVNKVCSQITNQEVLGKARIHPLSVLNALNIYSKGHGFRGSGTWDVVGDVVDALDQAFYLAFGNVTPSNKRILIGLDVSGSMSMGNISGIPSMTPRMGGCAMSMITYRTEPKVAVMAFSGGFIPVNVSRYRRLDDLISYTDGLPFDRTDCSLPVKWALEQYARNSSVVYDAFLVYTDSETWYGDIHPKQALDKYRREVNSEAKMVIVAMQGNDISIADPTDPGMLDVVGFDTATPEAISQFVRGDI